MTGVQRTTLPDTHATSSHWQDSTAQIQAFQSTQLDKNIPKA
jgi:hypothetical protein